MFKFFSTLFICVSAFVFSEEKALPETNALPEKIESPKPAVENATTAFQPFTGKVTGNKVRLRLKADLESPIIRQFNKADLLLIVGEKDNFWEVRPFEDTRFYVARNFITDGVVEGDRVNIRLHPKMEAPIVGQLQKGDKVSNTLFEKDPKWFEILPLESTCFYIAKEFIENYGAPEVFTQFEKKKQEGFQVLVSTQIALTNELKKPSDEQNFESLTSQFTNLLRDYNNIPDIAKEADNGLAQIQKQKNVQKANLAKATQNPKEPVKQDPQLWGKKGDLWKSLEDGLYLSWKNFHPQKSISDFYKEQGVNAIALNGELELYNADIKNPPGNYILKGESSPVAYLYSTKVDLNKYIGKKISILASPRPNNNFAFPAYFVSEIKEE